MDKESLVKLRHQLDLAIDAEAPEAYADLAQGLAEALVQTAPDNPQRCLGGCPPGH